MIYIYNNPCSSRRQTFLGQQRGPRSPAAIVSPPRRISILPMSLLAAKVSNGMGRAIDNGPDNVPDLSMICTSADVLFVSTLSIFQSELHQGRIFVLLTEDST